LQRREGRDVEPEARARLADAVHPPPEVRDEEVDTGHVRPGADPADERREQDLAHAAPDTARRPSRQDAHEALLEARSTPPPPGPRPPGPPPERRPALPHSL